MKRRLNGNGEIEPNECNLLRIVLSNKLPGIVSSVRAVLSSTNAGVTITQPSSTYSNLAANGTRTNNTPFQISTAPGLSCEAALDFILTVQTSTNGTGDDYGAGEVDLDRTTFDDLGSTMITAASSPFRGIAQTVFINLAGKASELCRVGPRLVLASWLYSDTRFTALRILRSERRRRRREEETSAMQTCESQEQQPNWTAMHPLLDEALDQLGEAERDALLIRFFEERTLAEVGQALGIAEDAAPQTSQPCVGQTA